MIRFLFFTLSLMLSAGHPSPAWALRVFACEPEWSSLVLELGDGHVHVHTATSALQDPHRIEPRPSLIAKMRRADLLVCTGADLESGWLPMLLRRSGNPRVQPGARGYFMAAEHVALKEVPTRLDRAEGDLHAYGNPHIQTDPRNIAQVAMALAKRLAEIDPAHREDYAARLDTFLRGWREAIERWERQARPLRGVPVVVQHRSWVYLRDWLGLKEVAALEPKPGIPPSSRHLGQVLEILRTHPARMVIRAAYEDPRPAQWLHEHTDIPVVTLPFTVGGTPGAKDLFGLFDDTVRRLLAALH